MQNCCEKIWEEGKCRWFEGGVLYHIYPLGMLGCSRRNEGIGECHRLPELAGLTGHLKALGVTAVYIGPLFESSTHGYDTKDYFHVDRRLGSDSDFRELVDCYHEAGMRVIVDGVFNHVGREFWGFREVLEQREFARTRRWFSGLRFDGRARDGVSYATWEGHEELVKLDLDNPEVRKHLLDAVSWWISEFHIDGIRLDAADCLSQDFVRALRAHVDGLKDGFLLVGEVIHGDYRVWANDAMMHGTTNYEAYKGLWSSHNDGNFHEIAYSLNRQFGAGGIYRGLEMYSFVDNHDVDRIATKLKSPYSLYSVYALMFFMPGCPSIYYGSEWGICGRKGRGYDADVAIRPAVSASALSVGQVRESLEAASLEEALCRFSRVRRREPALCHGAYRQIAVTPQTLSFERVYGMDTVLCLISDEPAARAQVLSGLCDGRYRDILNGDETFEVRNGRLEIEFYPHWARVLKKIA
ncbi:MAG: alpha-amylase [Proteobacteria bacterium]|nr:alpha-amylase [Pseudomonadota bacterium]